MKHNFLILVKKSQEGDKEALTEILDLWEPLILKTCKRAAIHEQEELRQHLYEQSIRAILITTSIQHQIFLPI